MGVFGGQKLTDRISQSQLDGAIERLQAVSKQEIKPYNCYGYSQLMTNDGNTFYATLGDSKKELYYQIHFLLNWLELEAKK